MTPMDNEPDPPIYRQLAAELLFELPLPAEVERVRPRSDVDATGEPIR